jgi:hypothetical protein
MFDERGEPNDTLKEIHMSNTIKIQLELPESRVTELEELMSRANITTRKDLFNTALTLLDWAVREKAAGRSIASVDERQRKYRELDMPFLSAVTPHLQP